MGDEIFDKWFFSQDVIRRFRMVVPLMAFIESNNNIKDKNNIQIWYKIKLVINEIMYNAIIVFLSIVK